MKTYGFTLSSSLKPGTRVLAVTSPTLIMLLLRRVIPSDDERAKEEFLKRLTGLMDAAQANPVHGVLPARVIKPIENRLSDHQIRGFTLAVNTDGDSLFETENAITEALGAPLPTIPSGQDGDGFLEMMAMTYGLPAIQFEREHPWFSRIGLTTDERSALLTSLGDSEIRRHVLQHKEGDYLDKLVEQSDPHMREAVKEAYKDKDPIRLISLLIQAQRLDWTKKNYPTFAYVMKDDNINRALLRIIFDEHLQQTRTHRDGLRQKFGALHLH